MAMDPRPIDEIVQVTVRNDTVAEVSYQGGVKLDSNLWRRYRSIDQLFDEISGMQNIDTAAYDFTVEYDFLLGYPRILGFSSKPPIGPTDVGFGYYSFF